MNLKGRSRKASCEFLGKRKERMMTRMIQNVRGRAAIESCNKIVGKCSRKAGFNQIPITTLSIFHFVFWYSFDFQNEKSTLVFFCYKFIILKSNGPRRIKFSP